MRETLKRLLSIPLAALLLAYEALDALLGPLVRPAIAWAASLELIQRVARWIAGLPPYGVLALFAVPFAIIEPFKAVALYWMAAGSFWFGLVALGLAHLASLLICERIFHAGKDRLLEIGWFARGYGVLVRVRDGALAWIRSTAAWRACAALAAEIRAWAKRLVGS